MNRYGVAAIRAAEHSRTGAPPRQAWDAATIAELGAGTSSQMKVCPRGAFLGLANAGLLEGITADAAAKMSKNGRYAVDAVDLLRNGLHREATPVLLWKAVMRGVEKKHNSQMDVVLSLWSSGQIVRSRS